jgi:hypothetical protein
MYQTKAEMSTARRANSFEKVRRSGHFLPADQPPVGGDDATWVTWPILRPGRAGPLP